MDDALMTLIQRRESLVRRSTEQRQRLLVHCEDGVLGMPPGSPLALLLERFGPWLRPAAMVAVPLALVAVLHRPSSLLQAARWALPLWQGYRTAQRWLNF